HECYTRTQIVSGYVSSVQRSRTAYDRAAALDLHVGAHLVELAGQREAAVEDALVDVAGAAGQRGHRHHGRLQVGGEAGVRVGDDVDRPQRPVAAHVQHRALAGEVDAHLLQLVAHDAQVEAGADEADLALRDGRGHGEHAGVEPVGHDGVLDGVQLVHALDGDEPGAATADLRAHLGEHVDHVEDLGLQRRVLDDRGALGQGGGHDEVLGAGVRGGVEVEGGAGQPGRLDVDDRLALVDDRAQALVAEAVEVEVAAAEGAAADALDDGLAEAVHQRGGEQHRPAEPAGDLGGQHGAGEAGGVDDERALGLVQLDVGAHGLGQLDRAAYVLDDRDVAQDGAAF